MLRDEKLEIWPSLDLMNGKVVRLIKGDPNDMIVYSNNPIRTAKDWEKTKVDGLHIIDLDATLGLGNNSEIVKKIAQESYFPIQVGGGLHSVQDVEWALDAGADRVIVGTGLLTGQMDSKKLLNYGPEKIVVALDYSEGKIVINGWRKRLNLELRPTLQDLWNQGFRLFLTTNIQRDGTLKGLNATSIDLIDDFSGYVYVAGGIASLEDLKILKKHAFKGAILGRVLYDKVIKISDALKVARDERS